MVLPVLGQGLRSTDGLEVFVDGIHDRDFGCRRWRDTRPYGDPGSGLPERSVSEIRARVVELEDAGQVVGRHLETLVWRQPSGGRGWIVPGCRPADDRWRTLPVDQE